MADSSSNTIDAGPRAERVLAQSIMSLVLPVAAQLVEERDTARAGGAVAFNNLSDYEQACLTKYNYLGYAPGFAVAAVTLGGLFGGMRYAAYRRFLKNKALPGSVDAHVKKVAQRQQYTALDKVGTNNSNSCSTAASTTTKTANKTQTPPAASPAQQQQQQQVGFRIVDAADLWTQLQLMLSGAVALLLGSVTANAAFDTTAFFRDVAQIPLQPGPSELCERVCPTILEKRRELLALDTLEPLHDAYLREQQPPSEQQQNQPPLSDLAVAVRQQRPVELWNFPATEQLEHAVALADNCQRRMDFVDECRRRKHRIDTTTGLVDVPEPVVPVKFVRL